MSTPASSTPNASTVVKSLPTGLIASGWIPWGSMPAFTSAAIAASLAFAVADPTNPIELSALGPVPQDLKLVYGSTAAGNVATWYRAVLTTQAAQPPFSMPTQNPGVLWEAIAGLYDMVPQQAPPQSIGLVTSGARRSPSTYQF